MQRIIVLDDVTANQIAAGEVIERPSSVVKELIENSLDAHAEKITIQLEDGGITSIKVIDNGLGMSKEDAELAFQRHATSKLKLISDLENLTTLGFRGEALASIASVSQVELVTKTSDSLSATKLNIAGGEITAIDEVGSPIGTSILVENLFYNTPARKKHLKGQQRELAVINDLIHKMALANPNVGFSLIHNSKLMFNFASGLDLGKRIFEVYGHQTAKEMMNFKAKNELFEIEGFIGRASISRSSRNHQSIFINNRVVKSKLISQAVENGYHTYLMINRFPLFTLHLKLNSNLVDVNVHPTKMEVRIDKEKELQEFLTDGVRLCLGQNFFKQQPRLQPLSKIKAEQITFNLERKPAYNLNEEALIFREESPDSHLADSVDTRTSLTFVDNNSFANDSFRKGSPPSGIEDATNIPNSVKIPYLNPIGQIEASYIVCSGEDGLYLVDQHAAHERILFEKLLKKEKTKTSAQQILIPITIEFKSGYTQLLIENIVLFSDLGFIIEHFGGDTFIIRGVPIELKNQNEKELILDILDYLNRQEKVDIIKLKEKALISMACKGAIKAGQKLEAEEILQLLSDLTLLNNPFTCPHGRPIIVHFSKYELDKKFKRIV